MLRRQAEGIGIAADAQIAVVLRSRDPVVVVGVVEKDVVGALRILLHCFRDGSQGDANHEDPHGVRHPRRGEAAEEGAHEHPEDQEEDLPLQRVALGCQRSKFAACGTRARPPCILP